jgi:hypothetical protein
VQVARLLLDDGQEDVGEVEVHVPYIGTAAPRLKRW